MRYLIFPHCLLPAEHLDFLSSLDLDLDVKAFQQLQHASIGYQSLTDVPQAVAYAEDTTDFKVAPSTFSGMLVFG